MSFKIRGTPPKATILNRPLLITLGAVVLFILFWSLISAFKATPSSQGKTLLANDHPHSDNMSISPIIAQLPQNYQDVAGVKKYLNPEPPISLEVSQELSNLRSQQSSLEAQLAAMNARPQAVPSQPAYDPNMAEAQKSALFFSSTTPSSSLFDSSNDKKNANTTNNTYNAPGTNYDQQNMQGQKLNFLQNDADQGDIYNHYTMVKPNSPYEVQAGTIIPADLLTAINTSLPGDIISQVRQDVYDTVTGQFLLIPKGSKLLGKYDSKIAYGQSRVLIVFDRIIRPDGTSIQLSNFTGSDQLGEAGFVANMNNHWGRILSAATISTMLSFGAGVAADNTSNNPSKYYPSSQQSAITGAASSVSQTGQQLTSKAMDIHPTLTGPAGFNFNVSVNKDMILQPFAGKKL